MWRNNTEWKYEQIDEQYRATRVNAKRVCDALHHERPTPLRIMANRFHIGTEEMAGYLMEAKAMGKAALIDGGWKRVSS